MLCYHKTRINTNYPLILHGKSNFSCLSTSSTLTLTSSPSTKWSETFSTALLRFQRHESDHLFQVHGNKGTEVFYICYCSSIDFITGSAVISSIRFCAASQIQEYRHKWLLFHCLQLQLLHQFLQQISYCFTTFTNYTLIFLVLICITTAWGAFSDNCSLEDEITSFIPAKI